MSSAARRSGGFADGQTICDTRTYTDRPRNCHVALDADRELFLDLSDRLLEKNSGDIKKRTSWSFLHC